MGLRTYAPAAYSAGSTVIGGGMQTARYLFDRYRNEVSENPPHNTKRAPFVAATPAMANRNYTRTMVKKKKKRKRKPLSKSQRRVVKITKRLVAQPDWSQAQRIRKYGITSVACAINKVEYNELLNKSVVLGGFGGSSTRNGVNQAFIGATDLSYRRIDPVGTGLDILDQQADITGMQSKAQNKFMKYRFDIALKFKNVSNGTAHLKVYLVQCVATRGTSTNPTDHIQSLAEVKQGQTVGWSILDDHFKDHTSVFKGTSKWKIRKEWAIEINAGQQSGFSVHVPYEKFNYEVINNAGMAQNDFLKGNYEVIYRIQGDMTHTVANSAQLGWSPAEVLIGYDLTEYASYLEPSSSTNIRLTQPTYDAVTAVVAEEFNPSKATFAA